MKKTEEQIKADLAKAKRITDLECEVARLRWELARAKWDLLDASERETVDLVYLMLKWSKPTFTEENIFHTNYIIFKDQHLADDLPF